MDPATIVTTATATAITVAVPATVKAAANIIEEKMRNVAGRLKLSYKKVMIPTREHFEDYYKTAYTKLSCINTLVFRHREKLLKDIYIPLTLVDNYRYGRLRESTAVTVDVFPKEMLREYPKILITDTAGMGKSTLAKKIFLDLVEAGPELPVFIELRRLNKDNTLLQELTFSLNSINKEFDKDLLLELLREGGFVFILDGYDEIPLDDKSAVTKDLQDFIGKVSVGNNFILTSRPEDTLNSFSGFKTFFIKPLDQKEAYALIHKYDPENDIAPLLIKELENSKNKDVQEFLGNPLLVSLLYNAFEFKQTIPLKKHIFYRQVYDAHFETHDLTKGDAFIHDKSSKLDIEDFHRVMRHLGFSCLKKQKIEFFKDELLELIDEARKYCAGLNFTANDFLKDILGSVPLFNKDGNYYKWTHKSLQEYFAAQFIYLDTKDNQTRVLETIYSSENFTRYHNLIDIYYDIDYDGFRNILFKLFLNDYLGYVRRTMSLLPARNKSEVLKRIYATIHGEYFIICQGDKATVKRKLRFSKVQSQMLSNLQGLNHYKDCIILRIYPTEGKNSYFVSMLQRKNHKICKTLTAGTVKKNSLQSFAKNVMYAYDFNPRSKVNRKEIFDSLTNILIRGMSKSLFSYIDLEDAQKEIALIERESRRNKSEKLIAGL